VHRRGKYRVPLARRDGVRQIGAVESGAGILEVKDDGRWVRAAVTSTTFSRSKPAPCSMALTSSSRNAAISRSRLSSGADDCSSVMKRTTRSAVSRWEATFNVSQCADPDTTWIA
jgi:hypothetical protein